MYKRLLSGLLALSMVLTVLPVEALAANSDAPEEFRDSISGDVHAEDSEQPMENEAIEQPAVTKNPEQPEMKENLEEPTPTVAPGADENSKQPIVLDSGDCGLNLTWKITDDETLTISGTGDMDDFYYKVVDNGAITNTPWGHSEIKTVILENGVTSIGTYAFSTCSSLTSVKIPTSMISIGSYAFFGCTALSSVDIPASITSIESYAFSDCSGLSSVHIPANVSNIGYHIFYGCSSLKSAGPIGGDYDYQFGWTKEIPPYAFEGCIGLSSVCIPEGVESIESCTFSGCSSLSKVTIPTSVTSIGHSAFVGCSNFKSAGPIGGDYDYQFGWTEKIPSLAFSGCSGLTNVDIPASVSSIGSSAFADCSNLASTNIPQGVESIEDNTFFNCSSLTSVSIPESVSSIGYSAFANCSNLTSVNIPETVSSIGYSAFIGCTSLTSVNIPRGVSNIENHLFADCNSLTSVNIPETVSSIEDFAFDGCTNLTSLIIPASVSSIGHCAFSGCSGLKTAGPIGGNFDYQFGWTEKIPPSVFAGCNGLTSVTIPNGVSSIGDYAFSGCNGLTSVAIPASVSDIGHSIFLDCSSLRTAGPIGGDFDYQFGWTEEIPSSAFYGCIGLISAEIPATVSRIGNQAFSGCTGLTNVDIPETVSSIGDYAFSDCIGLTRMDIPESLESIGSSAFYGCSGLTNVVIPTSVSTIGDHAFYNCTGLTSVTIPASVSTIGYYVFYGCSSLKNAGPIGGNYDYQFGWTEAVPSSAFSSCSSLTSVDIPNSITSIGGSAFAGCTGLTSVNIPDGVTSIGDYAFSGCSNLSDVTIPASVSAIGHSIFFNCNSLRTAGPIGGDYNYQFGWIKELPSSAFANCTNLTNVEIPEGTESIRDFAFSGCSNLTNITIPASVSNIGLSAFAGCSGLTSVKIPANVISIGDYAFSSCSGLTNVEIPEGVNSIGNYTFSDCTGLTNITIPDSVTYIGPEAFHGCADDFLIYCSPGSDAEAYAEEQNIPYQYVASDSRTLRVTVLAADGSPVTSGFKVVWYDKDGNNLGASEKLSGADKERTYAFEICLEDRLAEIYEQPERRNIGPEDKARCEVRLSPKASVRTLTLTGRAVDKDSQPLSHVDVSVLPGEGSEINTSTDSDGTFQASVPCTAIKVILQKDGYYRKSVAINLEGTEDTYNMGDCILKKVQDISDRLTLHIVQKLASEASDQIIEVPLDSARTLKVSLTGSDGRSITDFEIQGTSLLFKRGAVFADETLSVTVEDPLGAYAEASAQATLDSHRLGNAELTMAQKGSFKLGSLSGPEANLLIFDRAGKCIQTKSARSGMTSGSMDAGTYSIVLLKKSSLLRGIPGLDYFGTMGLTAGKDYLLQKIVISDGRIIRLDDCTVPALDESSISYTVETNTFVTTNKPGGAAVGELIMVRVSYELDSSRNARSSSLRIILPEDVMVVEKGAVLSSKYTVYTYDENSRTVSVPTAGKERAVLYLYCTASGSGLKSISAYLNLTSGAVQPIGADTVKVEKAQLTVPEKTSKAEALKAAGKTLPGSKVTLFDDDTEVGSTTANAVGSWSMSFDLVQPVYSYSYHFIYAKIENEDLDNPITTEKSIITYQEGTYRLKKITMYNTGDHGPQTTVFDFTDTGTAVTPYYRMWPSAYPTFTFKAEFDGDVSELSQVYVVTTDSTGDKTYVKTDYDPSLQAWVGTRNYTDFNSAPVQVSAAYKDSDIKKIPSDKDMEADMKTALMEVSDEIADVLEPMLKDALSLKNMERPDNDSIRADVVYTDPKTQETQELGSFCTKVSSVSKDVSAESLQGEGYELISDEKNVWAKNYKSETPGEQSYVDLNNRICMMVGLQWKDSGERTARSYSSWCRDVDNITDPYPAVKHLLLTIVGLGAGLIIGGVIATAAIVTAGAALVTGTMLAAIATAGVATGLAAAYIADARWSASRFKKKAEKQVIGHIKTLTESLAETDNLINERCDEDGSLRLSDEKYKEFSERLAAARTLVQNYSRIQTERINKAKKAAWGKAFSLNILGSLSNTIEASLEGLDIIMGDDLENWTFNKINDDFNELQGIMQKLSDNIKTAPQRPCGDEDTDVPPAGLAESSGLPMTYICDPSGYVYEAVPSNRLSGVRATVFSRTGGDRWEAEDYDQINPQTTGSDGSYYWDVPQGEWKVSFTKDGYQSTDTSQVRGANEDGWLPVPPPQLDINVGMVSASAPVVEQAVAYTDQAEVVFSQYMDIGSVEETLSMTCGDAPLKAEVKALDAESGLSGSVQYATRFAIIPDKKGLTEDLIITAGATAKNYAGTPMEESYTSERLTASVRPAGIEAPNTAFVTPHETSSIEVFLQPGLEGQNLEVESLTPSIVTIGGNETGTVITRKDGYGEISLTGILPGSGIICIKEPASGLKKTVNVQVGLTGKGEELAPVTASLEDGTLVTDGMTVPSGTKIMLQTQTQGGTIRYTLDDTCPCKDTALTYLTPIVINRRTLLRAAVYKNGKYSETIRLEINVSQAYTVTFNANGGTVFPDTLVTDSFGKLTSLPDAARKDHLFNGWYTAAEGGEQVGGDTIFTSNTTVYAQWSLHNYEDTVIPATTKKDGKKIRKCTVCGEMEKEIPIYSPKKMTLSKTSYLYDGKNHRPSVTVKDRKGKTLKSGTDYTLSCPGRTKAVGNYVVTVKFKGNYSGSMNRTYTITPRPAAISKITAKKKGITVKWKKQTVQVSGYEIVYSVNKKFPQKGIGIVKVNKNKKTSCKISKLKSKRKYYVKIRAYKTVKTGKKFTKIYSPWSKPKNVTTKK